MSRKRGKNKPSKSKTKVTDAVPEEVLAEGSGPNEEVEADVQALADAASDALPPPADVEIKGKKTRLTTDAWGQPIEVDDDEDEPVAEEAQLAAEIEEDAVAETAEEEQQFEEAVLEAEAAEAAEAVVIPDELAAVAPEGDEVADEELGAALPTTAASMDDAQLKNLVEALVFAADKPVTVQRLRQLSRVSDVKRLETALEQLAEDYAPRGVALQQVSGGYQFRTNTHYSVWVQQLIAGRPVRLSRAQLETLAIVAYRQPITRPEVDDIRGVDSSATLRLLLDRSLIRVLGKKEDVGRPTLYGTTKEFLDFFSLSDLRELPTLREYSELTAESRKVMSDRLGIDADAIPSSTEGDDDVQLDVGLDDDVPPVDQAADDAAAVAAVAAVTSVYGVSGDDGEVVTSDATTESDDDMVAASDESVSSGDEVVAADDATATTDDMVVATADATATDDVVAAADESVASGDEVVAADDATAIDDVVASADDATATDDVVVAADDATAIDDVVASADDATATDDVVVAADDATAMPDDTVAAADDATGTTDDMVEATDDATATPDDMVVAADDATPMTDDRVVADDAAGSTDDLLEATDDATTTTDDMIAAAAADMLAATDSEVVSSGESNVALSGESDVVSSGEDEPDADENVGMPRGAAQRDIIGRSTDLDEDPILRAAAEAELDAATAAADAAAHGDDAHGDVDAPASEALADDESSTGDLEAAGEAGTTETDATNAPDSSVLDASTAESLDETDEPPAD